MGKRKETETETIQVRIPVFKNVHVLTLHRVNEYARPLQDTRIMSDLHTLLNLNDH